MPDLLPEDFGIELGTPPVVILREQAEHLTKRMGGMIIATVATSGGGSAIFHRFLLDVPTLEGYVYNLFSVSHTIALYPAQIESSDDVDTLRFRANSPEEFQTILRELFAHPKTKRVITSLKLQAEAAVA